MVEEALVLRHHCDGVSLMIGTSALLPKVSVLLALSRWVGNRGH